MSATPHSARVGTSGSAGIRFALDTASARSLPDWMCGSAVEIAAEPTGGCEAMTAVMAGAAPLKWIAVMSSLAKNRKRCSAVRWGVVPLPGVAKPGFAVFAQEKRSARGFAGNVAFTMIALGWLAMRAVGMKSFSASYPGAPDSVTLTANADVVTSAV